MNNGKLSGMIIRIQDQSAQAGFPAAIITVAGETTRAAKPIVFFEQVRVRGDFARQVCNTLAAGSAVLFDEAAVEQQTWTTKDGEPRSRLITRASSVLTLRDVKTREVGEHLILQNAINAFTLRGRLARAAVTRTTTAGVEVTEAIVTVNLPVRAGSRDTAPHYLKVEAWRDNGFKGQPKGALVKAEVLVKTDSRVIDGQRRHFTVLEARAAETVTV